MMHNRESRVQLTTAVDPRIPQWYCPDRVQKWKNEVRTFPTASPIRLSPPTLSSELSADISDVAGAGFAAFRLSCNGFKMLDVMFVVVVWGGRGKSRPHRCVGLTALRRESCGPWSVEVYQRVPRVPLFFRSSRTLGPATWQFGGPRVPLFAK